MPFLLLFTSIRHLAHVLTVPPQKSVPTLHYTRRPGPVYTGRACRHLPSAVPWISKDRLLTVTLMIGWNTNHDVTRRSLTCCWCSPLTPWNALICQCTIVFYTYTGWPPEGSAGECDNSCSCPTAPCQRRSGGNRSLLNPEAEMIETVTGLALAPDPFVGSFGRITFCLRCSLLASIFWKHLKQSWWPA